MIALFLKDLESALRAGHGDNDAERLERMAAVFMRQAQLVTDREESNACRFLAADLREIASRLEVPRG